MKGLNKPLLVLQLRQLLQTKQEEWIEKAAGQWRRQLGNADDAVRHRCSSKVCHVRLGERILLLQLRHVLQNIYERLVNKTQ